MLILLLISNVPDGMMAFWEDTVPPPGWVVDSSFDGLFPRGRPMDSVGSTGGSESHKHTRLYGRSGFGIPLGALEWGRSGAHCDHKHELGLASFTSASHIPVYRDFLVIKKQGEEPGLPQGIILMFAASPPPDWAIILVDTFPRGNLVPGGAGGSRSHSHSFSGVTGPPTQIANLDEWGMYPGASDSHTHTYKGSAKPGDNLPSYLKIVFARLETPIDTVPVGAVAMFDCAPKGDSVGYWVILDKMEGRFPLGCVPSNVLEAGGKFFHAHGIFPFYLDSTYSTGPRPRGGTETCYSLSKHNHYVSSDTVRTDSASSIPPYRCTTFWQKVDNVGTGEASGGNGPEWKAVFCPGGIVVKGEPGLEVKLYDVSGKRLGSWVMTGSELVIKARRGIFFVRMERGNRRAASAVIVR